jgi:hypothetical protein
MLHTARHETPADAVIEHLGDLRQSQIPALIGLLLRAAAEDPDAVAKLTSSAPQRKPGQCADCHKRIKGPARRGLCRPCYDRNRYDGTIDRFAAKPVTGEQCAECRIDLTGDARRGLCRPCYDRHKYRGTLHRFRTKVAA